MSANELSIAFVSAGNVLSASVILPLLGLVAVGLRFWRRASRKMGVSMDDWLILLALLFVIGMGAVQLYGVSQQAVGYPSEEFETPLEQLTSISPEQRLVELIYWITWLLMLPANGLIKLSTIFLYRRIFMVMKHRRFDIASIVVAAICTLWTIAFFFATIFGCGTHVEYAWGSLGQIMSCNTNARLDGMMISDLITDIMVWILPIPVVWKLQMSIARKIGVTAIFLLAACSLAAAVIRLIIQLQISHGGYAAHTNVNLTLTANLFWCMIESGIALIASCLPVLSALFRYTAILSALSHIRNKLIKSMQSFDKNSEESINLDHELGNVPAFSIHVQRRFDVGSESQRSLRAQSDRSSL